MNRLTEVGNRVAATKGTRADRRRPAGSRTAGGRYDDAYLYDDDEFELDFDEDFYDEDWE